MHQELTQKHSSDGSNTSTAQERRAWLRTWAGENPRATISQAKAALRGEFGVAIGTEIVANILREAQDALFQLAKEKAPPPVADRSLGTPALITEIVSRMRAAGIVKIELRENGCEVLFNS